MMQHTETIPVPPLSWGAFPQPEATEQAVRDRTHWNSSNIKPRHPVELGLCTFEELEEAITRSRARRPAGEPALGSEEAEQIDT